NRQTSPRRAQGQCPVPKLLPSTACPALPPSGRVANSPSTVRRRPGPWRKQESYRATFQPRLWLPRSVPVDNSTSLCTLENKAICLFHYYLGSRRCRPFGPPSADPQLGSGKADNQSPFVQPSRDWLYW